MLHDLIAKGEGTHLEFKRTVDSAAKIAKTLAAFANTSGGLLLVGVQDNGHVQGIASEQQEMEKIEEAADRLCDPPLSLAYEVRLSEGKNVLLIRVAESEDKPHVVRDAHGNRVTYVRVRDKSVPAGHRMADILRTVQRDADPALVESGKVKGLLAYLRANGSINTKRFARLINVSERRALKMLTELARHNVLLLHEQHNHVSYYLRKQ